MTKQGTTVISNIIVEHSTNRDNVPTELEHISDAKNNRHPEQMTPDNATTATPPGILHAAAPTDKTKYAPQYLKTAKDPQADMQTKRTTRQPPGDTTHIGNTAPTIEQPTPTILQERPLANRQQSTELQGRHTTAHHLDTQQD